MRFLLCYPDSTERRFVLDVDATVPGDGITAIFGQSGSGKTSLLRCIAGLAKPEHGYFRVNGDIWQNRTLYLPTHERPLGYVFQEPGLFPHLTVKGNLQYAAKRSRVKEDGAFFRHVLSSMDIKPLLQRYPGRLSGGEQQRVAIARALLVQPRLLLMDEPMASLDIARKREILPCLERLREAFDFPVLYVSHAVDEVMRIADHALVLDRGKVVAEGGLGEVFSRVELSSYLGEEAGAIIQGRISEQDNKWHLLRVTFTGGELWVRNGGDALTRMVRVRVLAKDVSLALSVHDETSILNRIPAEVTEIVNDRDKSMSLVRLKSGSDYLLARITRKSVRQLRLGPGKCIWAQIKSAAIVR